MNQAQLAKHCGVSTSSLKAQMKKLAFQEGREWSWDDSGPVPVKSFSPMGISRMERRYEVPEADRYKPELTALGDRWKVRKFLPNPRLIEIENDRGQRGTLRVKPAMKRRFVIGKPIWSEQLIDKTLAKSRAGSIWTGIPSAPARKFQHGGHYPKNRGRYGVIEKDGTAI